MHNRIGSTQPAQHAQPARPARFRRVSVHDSGAADMLRGCPVVSADGQLLGRVEHLLVDAITHQLCYVMLQYRRGRHRSDVLIPWRTLYFDSSMGRLVFYTWS